LIRFGLAQSKSQAPEIIGEDKRRQWNWLKILIMSLNEMTAISLIERLRSELAARAALPIVLPTSYYGHRTNVIGRRILCHLLMDLIYLYYGSDLPIGVKAIGGLSPTFPASYKSPILIIAFQLASLL